MAGELGEPRTRGPGPAAPSLAVRRWTHGPGGDPGPTLDPGPAGPQAWQHNQQKKQGTLAQHRRFPGINSDCMALGRLQEGAKYSHGMWEQCVDMFRNFQKMIKQQHT